MIDAKDGIPVVQCVQVIRKPRCPRCSSVEVACYSTKGRTRYYRCFTCRKPGETTFKAIVV